MHMPLKLVNFEFFAPICVVTFFLFCLACGMQGSCPGDVRHAKSD